MVSPLKYIERQKFDSPTKEGRMKVEEITKVHGETFFEFFSGCWDGTKGVSKGTAKMDLLKSLHCRIYAVA